MTSLLRPAAGLALGVGAVSLLLLGRPSAKTAPAPRRSPPCAGSVCREASATKPAEPDPEGVLAQLSHEQATDPSPPALPQLAAKALSPSRLAVLIATCAPTSPASLVHSLVMTESGGHPLRLATNGAMRHTFSPANSDAAQATLAGLMAQGANVDVGLMQLNSATLARLHVAPAEVLDPCRNLAIGARIFDSAYAAAFARRAPTAPLWSASSIYNTGDPVRGLRNGYAGRVLTRLRAAAPAVG